MDRRDLTVSRSIPRVLLALLLAASALWVAVNRHEINAAALNASARLLREAGFAHVAVLRSGMEQWNEERLPVEAATDGV